MFAVEPISKVCSQVTHSSIVRNFRSPPFESASQFESGTWNRPTMWYVKGELFEFSERQRINFPIIIKTCLTITRFGTREKRSSCFSFLEYLCEAIRNKRALNWTNSPCICFNSAISPNRRWEYDAFLSGPKNYLRHKFHLTEKLRSN